MACLLAHEATSLLHELLLRRVRMGNSVQSRHRSVWLRVGLLVGALLLLLIWDFSAWGSWEGSTSIWLACDRAAVLCLKLLQVLVNEQALACKSVERSRVDLCDKSILHLAIDFVAEVVNEGFFIDIQLYSKALEFSLKGSKGVLVLI